MALETRTVAAFGGSSVWWNVAVADKLPCGKELRLVEFMRNGQPIGGGCCIEGGQERRIRLRKSRGENELRCFSCGPFLEGKLPESVLNHLRRCPAWRLGA